MSIGGLLLAAGLGAAFGSPSAVVLMPFVVVRRLNQPEVAGSWWAPVLVAGLLVVSGGEDPVLLSSCGLLLAADLARQQPAVPPESLVAGAMLMTAWFAPAELASLGSGDHGHAFGWIGRFKFTFCDVRALRLGRHPPRSVVRTPHR